MPIAYHDDGGRREVGGCPERGGAYGHADHVSRFLPGKIVRAQTLSRGPLLVFYLPNKQSHNTSTYGMHVTVTDAHQ